MRDALDALAESGDPIAEEIRRNKSRHDAGGSSGTPGKSGLKQRAWSNYSGSTKQRAWDNYDAETSPLPGRKAPRGKADSKEDSDWQKLQQRTRLKKGLDALRKNTPVTEEFNSDLLMA
jgi:hypothetical protein